MPSKYRTITLTDRPPVRIDEGQWPIVARAKTWDNRHECQANRTWQLYVRQHEDGRAIVYGVYSSQHEGARDLYAGQLVDAGGDIPATIRLVAQACDCEGIAQECIADLPAEDL